MLQGHKYKAAFQYTFRYTISQIHESQIKKQRNIWILSLFIILLQPKSVSWEEMNPETTVRKRRL